MPDIPTELLAPLIKWANQSDLTADQLVRQFTNAIADMNSEPEPRPEPRPEGTPSTAPSIAASMGITGRNLNPILRVRGLDEYRALMRKESA